MVVNQDELRVLVDVLGLDLGEAESLLEANYLQIQVVFERSPNLKRSVIRQEPEAGTVVATNTPMTIYVSSGGG